MRMYDQLCTIKTGHMYVSMSIPRSSNRVLSLPYMRRKEASRCGIERKKQPS